MYYRFINEIKDMYENKKNEHMTKINYMYLNEFLKILNNRIFVRYNLRLRISH